MTKEVVLHSIVDGLVIRIRTDNEILLKDARENDFGIVNAAIHYSCLPTFLPDTLMFAELTFRWCIMQTLDYVKLDLVFDASNMPDDAKLTKIYMMSSSKADNHSKYILLENDRATIHFEYDERDKIKSYDDYKMFNVKTPDWIINRAIRRHDNAFIKWLISSYPDDIYMIACLIDSIKYDNAEAFHLFEQLAISREGEGFLQTKVKDLISPSIEVERPEYAEYIKNHYA